MDEGPSFEEALERLDDIVQTLQRGGLTLEEAVALFEEGMGMARICSQRLDAAELRISQLQADADEDVAPPGGSEPSS